MALTTLLNPKPEHAERSHSPVGASGSHRWLHCPGSVALSASVPEQPSSPYALEGTKAHELSEMILLPALFTNDIEGALTFATRSDFDDDMLDHIEGYCRFVFEQVQERKPKKVLIEESFVLDEELQLYGTGDVAYAYARNGQKIGVIIDLKYGRGVKVEVRDNPQLAFYACALEAKYGTVRGKPFDAIECVIYQPRIECPEGPARSVELSRDEVTSWTKRLKAGAAVALAQLNNSDAELELTAGEHCRFCPGRPICSTHAEHLNQEAGLAFLDEKTLPVVIDAGGHSVGVPFDSALPSIVLDDDRLSAILRASGNLRNFLDALDSYALSRCVNGNPLPGWKVVHGPTRRKWRSEKVVSKGLVELGLSDEQIYDKKLRTLTSLEKVAGKGKIDHLTDRTKSSPVLVEDSDPRPQIDRNKDAAIVFQPVTEKV
jgi:hypothetical protein